MIDTAQLLIANNRIQKRKSSLVDIDKHLLNATQTQHNFIKNVSNQIKEIEVRRPAKDEQVILSAVKELQNILDNYNINLESQIIAIKNSDKYHLLETYNREKQLMTASYLVTPNLKSTKVGFIANKILDFNKIASKSSVAMTAIALELLNLNKLMKQNKTEEVNKRLKEIKVYVSSLK